MGKKINFAVFFMLMFVCFGVVTAQEHTGGTYSKQGAEYMDSGIIVNTLVYDVVKLNKDMVVYMTPYEISGKTLDNESVVCRLGIVSPDGARLYLITDADGDFDYISDGDIWVATIPGTFLNETGTYLLNWDCQQTLRGGYFNSYVEVTTSGESLTEGEAIVYSTMVVFLISFFIFMLFIYYKIPDHSRDDDGFVLNVSKLAYLKPVMLGLCWILLTSVMFIIANISIGYLDSIMVGTFLFTIFQLMAWSNLIIIPLAIIFMIQRIVMSKEMLGLIERGVEFK